MTRDVITACGTQFPGASGFATKGITYEGGGSGVGAGQMALGHQEIAPMSRALKSGEYCGANQGLAGGLLVGIDGVAIVTSTASSCSSTTANGVGKITQPGGYTLGGIAGVPASVDALRLIYMGLDQTGARNCASTTRKNLIQNWTNLFTSDPSCGGGDAHCTAGVTHAWRRSDTSGTTDGFVGVLTATNGAGLALATMSTAPTAAAQKVNPFCNSFEANDPAHSPQYLDGTALLSDGVTTTAMSDGHVNDSEDHDPLRTPCDANDGVCGNAGQCYKQTTQAACLATSAQCSWSGTACSTTNDLGVVLTVFIPDVAYGTTELYPTTDCSGSCALVPVITGGALPTGYKCPNGTNPIAGRCWVPVVDTTSKDPRCLVTDSTTRCFGTPGPVGAIDGRVWNKNTMVLSSEIPAAYRFAGATYQVALDRNNRLMDGSFYRMHMRQASSYNTRAPVAGGYTGVCAENDDTSQIGCLADADDCSVGYAGREASRTYPGAALDANKALKVEGISPFDTNVITNLVGSGTVYELARRLYVAAGPGGASLGGLPAGSGEQMLAQCFSKDSLVDTAITNHGYLAIPSTNGGVQCIDYPENHSTATPLVNVQGAGNVALGGCGSASDTGNGCANVDSAHGFLFGQ